MHLVYTEVIHECRLQVMELTTVDPKHGANTLCCEELMHPLSTLPISNLCIITTPYATIHQAVKACQSNH